MARHSKLTVWDYIIKHRDVRNPIKVDQYIYFEVDKAKRTILDVLLMRGYKVAIHSVPKSLILRVRVEIPPTTEVTIID